MPRYCRSISAAIACTLLVSVVRIVLRPWSDVGGRSSLYGHPHQRSIQRIISSENARGVPQLRPPARPSTRTTAPPAPLLTDERVSSRSPPSPSQFEFVGPSPLHIVQIGACDGDFPGGGAVGKPGWDARDLLQLWLSREWQRWIKRTIQSQKSKSSSEQAAHSMPFPPFLAFLVEPNPRMFANLSANAEAFFETSLRRAGFSSSATISPRYNFTAHRWLRLRNYAVCEEGSALVTRDRADHHLTEISYIIHTFFTHMSHTCTGSPCSHTRTGIRFITHKHVARRLMKSSEFL